MKFRNQNNKRSKWNSSHLHQKLSVPGTPLKRTGLSIHSLLFFVSRLYTCHWFGILFETSSTSTYIQQPKKSLIPNILRPHITIIGEPNRIARIVSRSLLNSNSLLRLGAVHPNPLCAVIVCAAQYVLLYNIYIH